ncbi:aminotransferase class III-fold pyridoxal phosphate-dependent enzyme [Pseudomonas sp. SWI36]|uniref:aminotransferase class III-fold pyridoxal phosphate-dependent enzyme n=1 Tax=Pseudomonas sp. SWI36 TaxID=2083052 RepID=UPI001319E1C4|nr:aminotransferase class III-fold pyridoxal phosphate-dependent enzyme [Pseudomonas sp. SWI36]
MSDTLVKRAAKSEALIGERPSLFLTGYEPVKGAPKFVRSAFGSRIVDVDGNEFVDLIMGYGSVILGHAHPAVQEKVYASISNGANPTLLSEVHVELAEKIQSLVPNAEKVTFLKTGSDAVSAAVRLARAITRRKYVLQWGMHGWHDWCCIESPGVLQDTKKYTIGFKYGDLDNLQNHFQCHPTDIACVVMMPYCEELPGLDYLEKIRGICTEFGALLIFDEVRSGFRSALGGAQQYFNVNADLVAFSKAMANGFPISALAGREIYMSHVLDLHLTITFYRDPIAMSAALETIKELERGETLRKLVDIGSSLRSHVGCVAEQCSIPVRLTGHEATPSIKFGFLDDDKNKRATRAFCSSMIGEGVLVHPLSHWFLSGSITNQDLSKVKRAISISMERVSSALQY